LAFQTFDFEVTWWWLFQKRTGWSLFQKRTGWRLFQKRTGWMLFQKRTGWRLFQKRAVCTKLDIYVFMYQFTFFYLKYKNVQYLFLIQMSSLLQYKLFLGWIIYHGCFIGKACMIIELHLHVHQEHYLHISNNDLKKWLNSPCSILRYLYS